MTTRPPPPPDPDRVHIVQLLCGPKRHAIMALPYAPGMSAQDIDDNDIVLTPDTAIPYLEEMFTEWLKKSIINPWCGICGAKTESWFYEDANTIFSSLEEALPHFARVEAEQLQTRKLFDEEIRGRSN